MIARRAVALVAAALGLSACSLAVTTSLDTVGCEQEGMVGPPACRRGQLCRAGECRPCAAAEVCGDGVDDDCDGEVDDGCGAGGSAGSAGAPVAGAAGAIAAGKSGAGGASGAASGGAAGKAGGGAAGTSGASGGGASGASGASGGAAGSGGSSAGAGGSTGGAGGSATAFGAPCTSAAQCPQGALCEALAKLGESMSGMVCTKPCCGSSQCGPVADGAACIPVKSGAGMCLRASSFGRPALGEGATGDPCGGDGGKCRSGFCEGGSCNDVCCKDAACGGSDECVRRELTVGTKRWAWACGKTVGGLESNKVCQSDAGCRSNSCQVHEDAFNTKFCSSPCCNSQACGAIVVPVIGSQIPVACQYVQQAGGEYLRSCATVTAGAAATGASCGSDLDCRTGFCVPGGGYCSDPCCGDSDCPAPLKCKPYSSGGGVAVLRCVK
ncbi:MAG: hypothetical protein IT374_18400 [Polyangiaceae bacterium]|nr:hypothetical protein [Polyangiaceae bacterium]